MVVERPDHHCGDDLVGLVFGTVDSFEYAPCKQDVMGRVGECRFKAYLGFRVRCVEHGEGCRQWCMGLIFIAARRSGSF